jgi:hypothetical protein
MGRVSYLAHKIGPLGLVAVGGAPGVVFINSSVSVDVKRGFKRGRLGVVVEEDGGVGPLRPSVQRLLSNSS